MKEATTDLYQILGIARRATQAEIRKAYRLRASVCHPDRGGTEPQMLELNLAFEILGDPKLRTEYDAATAPVPNPIVVRASEISIHAARQRAENYPRQWSAFESFLNSLSEDFQRADYGTTQGGAAPLPTAGKSASGWIFIIGGVVCGYFAFSLLTSIGLPTSLWHIFAIALIAGGGWIGALIHSGIADSMKTSAARAKTSSPAPGPAPSAGSIENAGVILDCPSCGQHLRIPFVNRKIRVTCTKCHSVFDP